MILYAFKFHLIHATLIINEPLNPKSLEQKKIYLSPRVYEYIAAKKMTNKCEQKQRGSKYPKNTQENSSIIRYPSIKKKPSFKQSKDIGTKLLHEFIELTTIIAEFNEIYMEIEAGKLLMLNLTHEDLQILHQKYVSLNVEYELLIPKFKNTSYFEKQKADVMMKKLSDANLKCKKVYFYFNLIYSESYEHMMRTKSKKNDAVSE